MSLQEHLTSKDIAQVLGEQSSDDLQRRVSVHVTDCDQCRDEMERLAAQPAFWQQASDLLTEHEIDKTVAFSSRFRIESGDYEIDEPTDGYSIKSMLEPPRHPEMLGRLEHYEVEREIGRGGMGVVLKAFDTELNRPVAIKMMAPHLACFGVARQRFAREARSAAAILHPNVIAIHGVKTESKTPWLVMPYIVGPSIEQIVLNDGAMEDRDLVCIAMQIAAGLSAAHAQGVVHRDIKPANVLIESGMSRVIITDFGLARAECDGAMTQTGWFAGTPNYMSPEQARGRDVDHRSDLFSLGSVMYYMSTGCLPFRADDPMAILENIRTTHPKAARSVNSRISETTSNLIDQLLEKRPEDRIQSAANVHDILERYLAYLNHPESRPRPDVKPSPSRMKSRQSDSQIDKRRGWARNLLVSVCGIACLFSLWAIVSAMMGTRSNNFGPDNFNSTNKHGLDGGNSSAASADSFTGDLDRIMDGYGLGIPHHFESELSQLSIEIHALQNEMNQAAVIDNPNQTQWDADSNVLEESIRELEQWKW